MQGQVARATLRPLRPEFRSYRSSSLIGGRQARPPVQSRVRRLRRQGLMLRTWGLIRALLRSRMGGVNPQHELFSCENNNLNLENSLPQLFASITLEPSSRKHARDHHRCSEGRHQSAGQATTTLRLVSAAIKDRDIAARTVGKTQATDAELLELF